MKIAVIGYGLIGKQRVEALKKLKEEGHNIEEIVIYDPYTKESLPSGFDGYEEKIKMHYILRWHDLDFIRDQVKPDWVFISTPHDVAPNMIKFFSKSSCKILVEKPFCRSYEEAKSVVNELSNPYKLLVGHNYRFYEGISQAVVDVRNGIFGDIHSINFTLAHGGSPSDATTWKLDKQKAGEGGCFLDLGVHLLDLLLQMNCNVLPVAGLQWQGFWNTGASEEAHFLLEGESFLVNMQVSIVKWTNTFRMEVNGKDGYGIVTGRGKNYGTQTYVRGKRWAWKETGLPQKETEELVVSTDCANSFHDEMDALFSNLNKYHLSPCTSVEALRVMKLYDRCMKVLK